MVDGIYTLANDTVYDQLVGLINSISANVGTNFPICILPYDNHCSRLSELVKEHPQVSLYDNVSSIKKWDTLVRRIWQTHPNASERWLAAGTSKGIHRMGTHRRYCAFDGPFDSFIYMDADTLLLNPVDEVFEALSQYDWVTYDFQYKDPSHVYDISSPRLKTLFSEELLEEKIFCSGFYGSKRGLLQSDQLEEILLSLKSGDAEVLYPLAPDQTILNYLVMKKNIPSVNLARKWPHGKRTGNSVTSSHFTCVDGKVFDQGKPLLYLHYIGISSSFFRRICEGENIGFPYRDTFLYYRYLNNLAEHPTLKGKPKSYRQGPNKLQRLLKKFNPRN